MDEAIGRVAEKFGTGTLAGIEANGLGPLTEMIPKPDYTGWVHQDGRILCPDCNKWLSEEPYNSVQGIVNQIAGHVCDPEDVRVWELARKGEWLEFNRRYYK